tara:strand:+ start:17 stop:481 length:465 start_codon:yes stop_codon:yes gene_type:complete
MEKLITLFLTLVVILPLQSANLEVEYPWNWEQIQADAELIKNTNTNILPDFEFREMASPAQYTIFWTLQALDVYSTYRGLKYQCVYEANPIIGKNPDLVKLVTHKTIFLHPVALLQPLDVLTKDQMQLYNVAYTTVVYNNYTVWNEARRVCTKR